MSPAPRVTQTLDVSEDVSGIEWAGVTAALDVSGIDARGSRAYRGCILFQSRGASMLHSPRRPQCPRGLATTAADRIGPSRARPPASAVEGHRNQKRSSRNPEKEVPARTIAKGEAVCRLEDERVSHSASVMC